jgi:secreted trypsin-like serine protease
MPRPSVILACLLACLLAPAVAAAATAAGDPPAPVAATTTAPVIGGDNAKAGRWPDVAAILFPGPSGDEPRCTGTLVAPAIVITAGHCYDPFDLPLPDNVLIGTSSLARPGDGETIAIKRGYVFPDAANTEDITVLVLARASSRTPRKIATGWARVDIANGAAISLVGFGAIDPAGDAYVEELQEASSTITDFDCSTSLGCNTAAQPAGELGAGGMGIDTCPGDSGGPLYLATSYGTFLAGVTSRSYDDARVACSEGGIYVRPDKVIDWIESKAGKVGRAPGPEFDPIVAVRGDGGDTRISVNDPKSDAHRFEITTPPAHGTAKVRGDGAVRVCTDPAAAPGDDAVTVTIIDTQHDGRALPITIPIQIQDGSPGAACDLDAFATGGCCDSGGASGGAIPLTIGVLALVLRRRR